jgi:hypothetical protein
MPSAYSENVNWQLEAVRDRNGSPVIFNDVEYRVTTESVSGANVGIQGLPMAQKMTLTVFIASADPRVFRFSPSQFVPVTDVLPPMEGDELHWHNLVYRVTRITYDDYNDDTHAIMVYAYRKVIDDTTGDLTGGLF